jgi:hypothetical protein
MHRANDLFPRIAQVPPNRGNGLRQAVWADVDTAPNRVEKLSLRDHPISVAQEVNEHRQSLGLHGHHRPPFAQLQGRNLDLEITKDVGHLREDTEMSPAFQADPSIGPQNMIIE